MNISKEFIRNSFYRPNGRLRKESWIRKTFPEEYKHLKLETSFLDEDVSFSERLYCVFHNITSIVKCKTCGVNPVGYDRAHSRYRDYCSLKCMANDSDIKMRRAETNIKKYGHVCNLHSGVCREKMRKTCLEKYGVEHYSKSDDIKSKKKKTFLDRYGVPTPGQIEDGKEKSKRTCREKYGVEYTGQIKERREKMKNTMMERYGVSYYLEKRDIPRARFAREMAYDEMMKNNLDTPLFSKDDFVKTGCANVKLKFRCKKCGNIFEAFHRNGFHRTCEKCFPVYNASSIPETEFKCFIKDILETNDIGYVENDRDVLKPRELDLYVADKKIAFEFDGLYWHSDKFRGSNYHTEKTNECFEKNIKLIHVFEDEWYYRKDIVKSRIKNLLGFYDTTIYARKCMLKSVPYEERYSFLEKNHTQGDVASSVDIGLYYENELVSIMTFGKPRFNRKYKWELLRFCNKLGYHIPGAASKPLKHFEENYKPSSIISYADRRWSTGNLYNRLGFTLHGISKPNYWYWSGHHNHPKLENRIIYQKHKLPAILDIFLPDKSEVENMKMNGYNVVYDCGNLVFVKEFESAEILKS